MCFLRCETPVLSRLPSTDTQKAWKTSRAASSASRSAWPCPAAKSTATDAERLRTQVEIPGRPILAGFLGEALQSLSGTQAHPAAGCSPQSRREQLPPSRYRAPCVLWGPCLLSLHSPACLLCCRAQHTRWAGEPERPGPGSRPGLESPACPGAHPRARAGVRITVTRHVPDSDCSSTQTQSLTR